VTASEPTSSRLKALLRQRCPRCRRGKVFAGQLAMLERCPVCDLVYGREPGYFTGAMYASYVLSVPLLAGLTLLVWLVTRWPIEWALVAAALIFLLFVPAIFRYSRVLWIHFDRWTEPED
jgi:uncharacterized protein (DUF983 family)